MITLADMQSAMENISPAGRNSKAPYDIEGQVCRRCETYKLLEFFGKGSNYKVGFNSRCKACVMEIKRENRVKRRHHPTVAQ